MGYYMAGGSVNPDDIMVGIENAARASRARAQALDPAAFGSPAAALAGTGWKTDDPTYELDRPASPRMNVANPRAARRAMRRITAFAKAAQKIVRFPKAKRHHKAAPFRRRRKRK